MKTFSEALAENVAARVRVSISLTHNRLVDLLHYDAATGLFTRKVFSGGALPGTTAGTLRPDGYIQISIDRRLYFAHRLAAFYMTGEYPTKDIDHIDGDRKNNAYANLRLVTNQQNSFNFGVRHDNTSGVKGVRFNVRWGKWEAWIGLNGVTRYIGGFERFDDAVDARMKAAAKLYGEFASEVCR